jgi:DNA-binding CsgD family transcriptional regulator/tetratricopeptide (TPR) repeat protein
MSSPVLVGREADLAVLTGEIEASADGSPRFVVVRGEAGIGKSRLVQEAMAAARDAGALVLVGECLDIGPAGLPYLALAAVLRDLSRSVSPDELERLLGPARRELGGIVPELAGPDALEPPHDSLATAEGDGPPEPPPAPDLPAGLAQARLFERVLGLFGALSATSPTVLVIEDVHWIDRATRDLLTFLSRNLTTERLAIVLTCRTDDLPRGHPILVWLAELGRAQATAVIELARLDRDTVERQLRVIGEGELEPGIAERIWRRSQGNPLLVEELFAAGGGAGPASAVEVLLARVTRLDPTARAIVDAAAIGGRPVDDRLLSEVLETTPSDVDEGLRAALAQRVLEAEPGTERYRFRHELLREVVEGELLAGTRRRLHERFARKLQMNPDLADPSPAGASAELAHHFAQAGLVAEAFDQSIRAAEAAEAVHAYADAHRQWEHALSLERHAEPAATDGERVELRRRAAEAANLGGEVRRSMELTREALGILDAEAAPVQAGLLHSRIGYLQWSLGDGAAALAEHREAVRLVPAEPPTPEGARVLAALGGALMGAGKWAESLEVCEAAIARAARAGATIEESRARNILGSDLVALGRTDEGLDQLREACRLAELADPGQVLIVGRYNLALNLALTDHLDEALEAIAAGHEAARAAGLERRHVQDLAALHGDVLIRLGRVDAALAAVSTGLALAPRATRTAYLSAVRARIDGIRGDIGDVELRLGGIDLHAEDPDTASFVAAVLAEARCYADRPAEALAAAEAGLRQLEGLDDVLWTAPLVGLGLRALAELAEVARARRSEVELRGTAERLAPMRAHLERVAAEARTASGRGWVALARGELARARGADSVDDWMAATSAFDEVPDLLNAAYARFRGAEATLRREGVKADVGGAIAEAAAVAASTGARPLAEAIAGLAARARITPRPAMGRGPADASVPAQEPTPGQPVASRASSGSASPGHDPRAAAAALGLSSREIEVLELVAAGCSNGEIAERLFITRKTAAVHVTHILDKLGVPNRVGAAMVAARVGLGKGHAGDELDLTGPR